MNSTHDTSEPKVHGGLIGAGAAACAVCCAAPLMALLGIGLTGAALTAVTLAFAGVVFGLIVALATVLAVVARRRRLPHGPTAENTGPVAVDLLASRPAEH